ncbi:MAG TPA: hypothetical protein VHG10_02130 [Glycomyces sp.]|nr:hypothetical protein [Glycomyces sp.]
MTYPPQDAAAAGDQNGQSPPPPGGYAPGQVGADGAYPTSQVPASSYAPTQSAAGGYPGQFDPGQPQPYPQQGYSPYVQYGPPPVQPSTKSGGTAFLVIGVVILMVLGGVAGFLFIGGGDDAESTGASDDTTGESGEEAPEEPGGEDPTEESAPVPSGTHLEVASLGSVTPIPGAEWQPYVGPGVSSEPLADAELYAVNHTETWISVFAVGLFSGAYAAFDPSDLNASAASAAEVWLGDGFDSVQDYQMGEMTFTEVEVDGRPGVLAEWRNSWTSAAPETTDLYEDTALLVVDVDGVNGFIGVASVSESGAAMYDPAIEALLATDFDAQTA